MRSTRRSRQVHSQTTPPAALQCQESEDELFTPSTPYTPYTPDAVSETPLLDNVSSQVGPDRCEILDPWAEPLVCSMVTEPMVEEFNRQFQPVLHVFDGQGPNGALSAQQLEALFTPDQLDKLQVYLSSGTVPRRMFNGVQNTAEMTPQRRIVLSAHILMHGTFDPATILEDTGQTPEEAAPSSPEPQGATTSEQAAPAEASSGAEESQAQEEAPEEDNRREIAANSCRHWAMMVYGYAGLPSPGEGADGLWHTHDATGAIMVGGTAPSQTDGSYGSASGMSKNHRGEWAPFFGPGVQAADIFKPGDWLQLAWSSGGGHSVVLTRVVRENRNAYWIDYYSQTRNGLQSERRIDSEKRILKTMAGKGTRVFAHRPMSQAQDPQSAADLFQGLHAEVNGQLRSGGPNEQTLRARVPGLGEIEPGGEVLHWLCTTLVGLNRQRLAELGDRLTPSQLALFESANAVGEASLATVEQLVRLNQRVVHTLENDAHTRHNAAQEDRAGPHYRVGRFSGGNGLYGAWDPRRSTSDGAPRPQAGKLGSRQVAALAAQRSSGLLRAMPDLDRIPWSACPGRGAAPTGG